MKKYTLQKNLIIIAFTSFLGLSAGQAQTLENSEKVSSNSNIYQPVYNPEDGYIYVSAAKENQPGTTTGYVYKIETNSLKTVDSIAVPFSPPMGIGINVKTQFLYTTNSRTGLVTAIDLASGEQKHISAAVPVVNAREVIVDETRNLIYVTNVKAGGIWVIDGVSNTFQRFIYNLGGAITGAALDTENNRLYATAMRDNKIIVVDAGTGIVEKRLDAHGERPTNVYFDKAKNRLFVANQTTENITVLDAESGELIKEISTGKGALGVDYDPKNDLIYVANRHGRSVNVINGSSLEVLDTFDMQGLPNTFAIDHANGNVYVTLKDAIEEKDEQGNTFVNEAKYGDAVSLIKSE